MSPYPLCHLPGLHADVFIVKLLHSHWYITHNSETHMNSPPWAKLQALCRFQFVHSFKKKFPHGWPLSVSMYYMKFNHYMSSLSSYIQICYLSLFFDRTSTVWVNTRQVFYRVMPSISTVRPGCVLCVAMAEVSLSPRCLCMPMGCALINWPSLHWLLCTVWLFSVLFPKQVTHRSQELRWFFTVLALSHL